jgi:uncharacterized protein (DUF2141 family)
MKLKALLAVLVLSLVFLAGCTTTKDNDTATTASIVDKVAGLEEAIGSEGTWIVAILNDLKSDQPLVIEGEFYDGDDTTGALYRKLALYAQDADRKITDRYTLTAPKLTIKSPNTKIQGGTFVGDVYVESEGFTLTDATIDGDLFFTSAELANTFTIENGGKVTGKVAVGGVDITTSPSLVIDDANFAKAIGPEGTWIVAALNNISTKEALTVEGDFHNNGDATTELYRKIALYAQDANRNITARYTLTTPSLTIKSPNAKIQGGTVVGDIYVEAKGFTLTDAKIEGNLYFATQELLDTYVNQASEVTGESIVKTK